MASPLTHPADRGKADPGSERLAFFFSRDDAQWLLVAVGALPRRQREKLQRELEMQFAGHGFVN